MKNQLLIVTMLVLSMSVFAKSQPRLMLNCKNESEAIGLHLYSNGVAHIYDNFFSGDMKCINTDSGFDCEGVWILGEETNATIIVTPEKTSTHLKRPDQMGGEVVVLVCEETA